MPAKSGFSKGLVRLYGNETGRRLAVDVDARLQALILFTTPPRPAALRWLLQKKILPSVALYRSLLGHGQPAERALESVDKLLAVKVTAQQKMASLIGWLPASFSILRFFIRLETRYMYPPPGWQLDWRQDTPDSLDFDITRCYYLQTLTGLGHPELVPAFCRLDDLLGQAMASYARFERFGTLATGAACCDFCFKRAD